MPNMSSYADYLADWERLLLAVENNEELLPDLMVQRVPLQDLLEEAKELSVRQKASMAQLREDSKRRRALVPEGRAAASRLRSALKAHFGGHSEKLVEYGIAPLRARRALPPDPVPVPVEIAEKPAPPAPSAPSDQTAG